MCEKLKCVHCGKTAKFRDDMEDPYCSEECYLMTYKITDHNIITEVKQFCKNCDEEIYQCVACEKYLGEDNKVFCDTESGMHFCSESCMFKYYTWSEIKPEGDE